MGMSTDLVGEPPWDGMIATPWMGFALLGLYTGQVNEGSTDDQ